MNTPETNPPENANTPTPPNPEPLLSSQPFYANPKWLWFGLPIVAVVAILVTTAVYYWPSLNLVNQSDQSTSPSITPAVTVSPILTNPVPPPALTSTPIIFPTTRPKPPRRTEPIECQNAGSYVHQVFHNVAEKRNVTDSVEKRKLQFILNEITFNELANVEGGIVSYTLSPDEKTVVAIVRLGPEDQQSSIVYSYNFETQQVRELFREKVVTFPEQENSVFSSYKYQLQDVKYGANNASLLVTTTTGLLRYDLSSGVKTTLFGEVPTQGTSDISIIFSYSNPRESNDGKYVLLNTWYWEGQGNEVYSTTTDNVDKLKYSSYMGGATIDNWYGDLALLSRFSFGSEDPQNGFYLVSPPSFDQEQLLFQVPDLSSHKTIIMGHNIIYQIGEREFTGICTANNVGDLHEIPRDSTVVVMHDGIAPRELLRLDSTNVSGVTYRGDHLKNIELINLNGKGELVVGITFNGSQSPARYFIVPLSGSEELIELLLN